MYQKRNKELEVLGLYRGGYAKQFYLREISALTKIPLKTTQNVVAALEKNNILKSAVRGKNKYFGLNRSNILTKLHLLQAEVYRTALFLEKYPLFKTFLKEIRTNNPVIAFGSFAKGTADKRSDADLLIIPLDRGTLPFHLLPYKVHEIRLSPTSFIQALTQKETLIKEIEENHIILNNHSFYIQAMWDQHES